MYSQMSGALGDSTNCRNASQWQSVLDRNTNEQRQATTKQKIRRQKAKLNSTVKRLLKIRKKLGKESM